jgi:hypothetical protein
LHPDSASAATTAAARIVVFIVFSLSNRVDRAASG